MTQKYNNFKPTRLYIKRHKITGLLYFGKHTGKHVERYSGSGAYWKRHIQKHGIHQIETIWISDWFYDPYEIEEFSLFFSQEFNILNDKDNNGNKIWANLVEEDGLLGGAKSEILCENDSILKKVANIKKDLKQRVFIVDGVAVNPCIHDGMVTIVNKILYGVKTQ